LVLKLGKLREKLSNNLEQWKKKRLVEKERDNKLQIRVNKVKRDQYEKGRIARAKDDGWKEGIGVKNRSTVIGRMKTIGSTVAKMSESFQQDFLIDSGFRQKQKPHRKSKPKKQRKNNRKKTNKKRSKQKKQKQQRSNNQEFFFM